MIRDNNCFRKIILVWSYDTFMWRHRTQQFFLGIRCQDRSHYCGAWANDGRCKTDRWVYDNCLLSCKRFTVCDKEMIKPTGKHFVPYQFEKSGEFSSVTEIPQALATLLNFSNVTSMYQLVKILPYNYRFVFWATWSVFWQNYSG